MPLVVFDAAAYRALARDVEAPATRELAGAAHARVAAAAAAGHPAKDRGARGGQPFALADDPESRLCAALGLQPPPGLAAWNEYLASVAAELAAEPTPARAQRLA